VSPEQLQQAIDAIAELHEAQPEGEKKKPNVAEVEALVGFDLDAAARDEAWEAYQSGKEEEADEEGDSPSGAPPPTASVETTRVTNRYRGALSINGVRIGPGESGDVPRFDRENAVMRAWLEAEVISLS